MLHVLPTNQRRGAESFAYDLHLALAARGVRSAAVCLEPAPAGEPLPVVSLGPRRFSLGGVRRLRESAAQAHVVIAHGSNSLLACSVGLRGLRTPFIYVNIGDSRFWAASWARRTRVRWMLGRAAQISAISPGSRQVLLDHFGLNSARVRVIPNGRRADRFPQVTDSARTAARRVLDLPDDRPIVAMLGALSAEKRVDLAIEALGELPETTLVVAGNGPERSALEELADRVAPGQVRFLGVTDAPATVLAAADILVVSSDSEGVPGVLIEAGLSGLPTVATDVGWVSDVVVHERTGLLVPPRRPDLIAEGVRRAYDERTALGAGAREHCLTRFEMASVVDSWLRMIEDVAGKPDCETVSPAEQDGG